MRSAEVNRLEREVRLARTRRKRVAEDLAQFLGVPVALDAYWRPTVMLDGEEVLLSELVPINATLAKKATS